MSSNPKHVEQMSAKTPSFKTIDREIKTLTAEMEQEQIDVGDAERADCAAAEDLQRRQTAADGHQRAAADPERLARGAGTVQQRAVVAAGGDEVAAEFKAGKDL